MGFFDTVANISPAGRLLKTVKSGNPLDMILGGSSLFGGGEDGAGGVMGGASFLDSPLFKKFYEDYRKAYDEARAENLKRYNEVKGNYADLIKWTHDTEKNLGQQARRDINQGAAQQVANVKAAVTQRGLGATTVPSLMERGVMQQRHDAIGTLNEQLRRERISNETQLQLARNNFIERASNSYPNDPTQFLMQAAQSQMGAQQPGGLTGLFNSLAPITQAVGPLLPFLIGAL